MKKGILFLLVITGVLFAQMEPQFQAFAPNFMKLGKYSKGFHSFELLVEGVTPWSFSAKGEVKAPNNDEYLLLDGIDDEEVVIIVAYLPFPSQGTDGKGYQVGIFDLRVFLSDEPLYIRNLEFKLLPPANDNWAQESFEAAKVSSEQLGQIWNGTYDREITVTSADPIDRKKWLAAQKAAKKKEEKAAVVPPPAEETKVPAKAATQPAATKTTKKADTKTQNTATEKSSKKKMGTTKKSAATQTAEPELTEREKRQRAIAQKSAVQQQAVTAGEDDESQLTEKEKRRRALQKKK